jgi:serine/threonine protein kinase
VEISKEYVFESMDHTLSDGFYPLKADILIDRTGHACLADFNLVTIAPDATGVRSSNTFAAGGSFRWMSPELLSPERFNLIDNRPTKSSNCYALGMVIYEVLSGRAPFFHCHGSAVISRMLDGERPVRPRGVGGRLFTDEIWNLLERCWKCLPEDRPRVEEVLQFLEEASRSWKPPPMVVGRLETNLPIWDSDSSSDESSDSSSEDSSDDESWQSAVSSIYYVR